MPTAAGNKINQTEKERFKRFKMEDPFETKLDRVLAYLQGVKDIPTLQKIMGALKIKPSPQLNMSDRREVVRALTSYLNDDRNMQGADVEEKLDRVSQIQMEYFERSRREVKREPNPAGGARVRDGGERVDVPGAAVGEELFGAMAAAPNIPYHQYAPAFDLLGGGVDLMGDEIGDGNFPAEVQQQIQVDAQAVQRTPERPIPPPRPPGLQTPGLDQNGQAQEIINVRPEPADVPVFGGNAAAGPVPVVVPAVVAPPLAQNFGYPDPNNFPAPAPGQNYAQPADVNGQYAHVPVNNAPVVVRNAHHGLLAQPPVVPVFQNVQPAQPVAHPVLRNVQPAQPVAQPAFHQAQPVAHPVVQHFQPVQPVAHAFFQHFPPPVPVNVPARAPNPVPFVPVGNLVPGIPQYNPRPRMAAAAPAAYYGGGRLRECKINGKIVNPGEKDGIAYSSLMYQIEAATRQGYQDVEVCAAVIRATNSKALRGVLESNPGATIADIIPALKAHFTVKNVNSVFHELGKGKQERDENPLQFLMRMINVRGLVTRMNREEGGDLTPQLIQSQFQDSLSTGFKGELRHLMRGILRVPNVQDNVLMKEVTDLMLNEAEHEEKEGEKKKVAEVNSVGRREEKEKKNQLMTRSQKFLQTLKTSG